MRSRAAAGLVIGRPGVIYHYVPLMPSETKQGIIKPIADFALPMIKWRIRDLAKDDAPVVMQHLPTCANCHSFSVDGKVLAMDMDGPDGDKGAYVIKPASRKMVIASEDVITWNRFTERPKDRATSGLFARLSPDGRYVATMLNEQTFVANYPEYQFLQTFYPTRGILVIYDRRTKTMKRLPGADDPQYVQGNPEWSPDGKTIVFIRAKAMEAYETGKPAPDYANDPNERQIRYDLYRIPFNEGRGGTATPIPGASGNGWSHSFPRFTPDGKWIVYVRCRNGMLMRPDSELYILPAEGGTPRRMNCNTKRMNSYHSFSPNGRWMVFASKTNTPYTQMFLTHIDADGTDTPAILIGNSTAPNRAVNLPEFANIPVGELVSITTPAVEYRHALNRARDLKKAGKADEALAELRRSLALKPDYPGTLVDLGDTLLERGKPTEAEPLYRRALEIHPRNFWARNNLAAALAQQGKLQEAVTSYRKAVELRPREPKSYVDLGAALFQLGKTDEAVRSFLAAIQVAPRFIPAHHGLGTVMMQERRFDLAVTSFRKVLAINPKYHPARHDLGMALEGLGKMSEAVAQYRAVLKAEPGYVLTQNNLAWLLATSKDDRIRDGREAVRLATLACEVTSRRHAGFLDTLAGAYAEVGRFDDAVKTAEEAVALARAGKQKQVAAEIEKHLALFGKKLPLRY